MNYKIINDIDEVQNFINVVLPNLEKDELFYVSLLARGKYSINSDFKHSDKIQLKRFTSTKDRLIEKIKKLEVQLGQYTEKGQIIPEHMLALYIMPNPRSCRLAQLYLQKQIADNVINNQLWNNPQSMALTELQKRSSNRMYYDIDIDINHDSLCYKKEILFLIQNALSLSGFSKDSNFHIIETNGGFHILINLNNEPNKNWYITLLNNLNKIDGINVDMKGDNLLPIPGCLQGNFIPKIIK